MLPCGPLVFGPGVIYFFVGIDLDSAPLGTTQGRNVRRGRLLVVHDMCYSFSEYVLLKISARLRHDLLAT